MTISARVTAASRGLLTVAIVLWISSWFVVTVAPSHSAFYLVLTVAFFLSTSGLAPRPHA